MNNENGSINFSVRLLNDKLRADANQSLNILRSLGSGAEQEGKRIDEILRKAAVGAAAFFSIQQATQFIKQIQSIRGEFQQLEIAFSTMLQSRERANVLMTKIVDLAAKTPFGLQDAAQGAKQLLAYGSAAETVTDELRMLGDIASGVSAPLNDIVYLYGTLRTQGRAYAMDIRQFAGRGIPIYSELAKVLGVTTSEVSKLVEAGKVGFAEVEKAFKNMTAQGGMFHNLMEEQSKSLVGQMANLQDQIDIMFNEIGKSSEGIFSGAIEGASFLVEHYKEIAKILGVLIASYGSYRIAVSLVAMAETSRSKVLAQNAALLSQEVKDEIIASNIIRDKSIALQQEAIATANAVKAKHASLQAEVAEAKARMDNLVAIELEKTQLAQNAALQLNLANKELAAVKMTGDARRIANAERQVEIATKKLAAAEDQATIARQTALAASTDFAAKKKSLETSAIAVNTAMKEASAATNKALIATENAAAASSARLTLAQHAQALGARLAAGAQALLNATMLSNPIVATVAIVGGLVAAYFSLRDSATAAEKAQERLNKRNEEAKKIYDELKNKAQEYINIINNDSQTNFSKLQAFQELQKLYPERLKNLSLEEFLLKGVTEQMRLINYATEQLSFDDINKELEKARDEVSKIQKNIDDLGKSGVSAGGAYEYWAKQLDQAQRYLSLLEEKAKEQAETAKIAGMTEAQKLEYYIKQRDTLEEQIKRFEAAAGPLKRLENGVIEIEKNLAAWSISSIINQFNSLTKQINSLKSALGADGKPIMTVSTIDDEIKRLKEERDRNSSTSQQYKQYSEQIKKLEQQRAAITGEVNKKVSTEYKRMAEDRRRAVQSVIDAEKQLSTQLMIEGERQIQEVRNKYQRMRDELREARVSDKGAFAKIDEMELRELDDLRYRRETADLASVLDDMKKMYMDFEDYKAEYGVEAAKRAFSEKLDVEKTFLQKLSEIYDIYQQYEADMRGNASDAAVQDRKFMFQSRLSEGRDADLASLKKEQAEQKKMYNDLLQVIDSYTARRIEVEDRYKKYFDTLEKERTRLTISEYQKQKSALEKSKREELRLVEIFENEKLRILQQDLTTASKEQLEQAIKDLEQIVKTKKVINETTGEEFEIPPAALESLRRYLQQLYELLGIMPRVIDDFDRFQKVVDVFNSITSGLRTLSSEVGAYNEGLRDTLETLSDMVEATGQLVGGAAIVSGVASGKMTAQQAGSAAGSIGGWVGTGASVGSIFGPVGTAVGAAVGAVIGGIQAIVKSGKKVRESLEKMYAEFYRFQLGMEMGEYKINETYRERLLLQAKLVEGTLKQVEAQKKALETNKQSVALEERELLQKLQAESYISGQHQQKYGGFLGMWRKSRAVNDYSSLAGKTFEEIEALYLKGQLDGRAKELFEQLKKVKEEGKNIDEELRNLQVFANEIITGTTAESITDSIVEGFRNGKKSIEDFADDFESLVRNAMLNALKYQYLEAQMKSFYEDFAAAAEDGLSSDEMNSLKNRYSTIISGAAEFAETLEKITGVSLANLETRQASQKSIASMSQDSANELNGRFAVIQMHTFEIKESMKTMVPILEQATAIKGQLSFIQNTASAMLVHLASIDTSTRRLESIEGDIRSVKQSIDDINIRGIKIRA